MRSCAEGEKADETGQDRFLVRRPLPDIADRACLGLTMACRRQCNGMDGIVTFREWAPILILVSMTNANSKYAVIAFQEVHHVTACDGILWMLSLQQEVRQLHNAS